MVGLGLGLLQLDRKDLGSFWSKFDKNSGDWKRKWLWQL